MGKDRLDSIIASKNVDGFEWETIHETGEKCPKCNGELFIISPAILDVLGGNTVYHCNQENDHTFWSPSRGGRNILMYHPDSSETTYDFLEKYESDEFGNWEKLE